MIPSTYAPATQESPAVGAYSVTPSDSVAPGPQAPRALYVGGSGDVAVKMQDDTTVTLVGVQGGSIIPVQVVLVLATGTTATDIVALY